MTYAFTHMGNFLLLLGLEFGSRGWDLGLEVGIWASRLGLGPRGGELGLCLEGDREEGGEGENSPYV